MSSGKGGGAGGGGRRKGGGKNAALAKTKFDFKDTERFNTTAK